MSSVAAIKHRLEDKYLDLAANVTHIYDRFDLLLASDLIFHSVLRFRFRNT